MCTMARGRKTQDIDKSLATIQAKLNSLLAQKAEKQYGDIPVIAKLKSDIEAIGLEGSSTKALLNPEGPRSLEIRLQSAQLRINRYKAEKNHNLILSKLSQAIEAHLNSVLSDSVRMLSAGKNAEEVSKSVNSQTKTFQKNNADALKEFNASLEEVNKTIQACKEFYLVHTPQIAGKEMKKDHFRAYGNPFSS